MNPEEQEERPPIFSKEFWFSRREADFDRACDEAWQHVRYLAPIDQNGYCTITNPITDHITVKVTFVSYEATRSPVGGEHLYFFKLTIHKDDE